MFQPALLRRLISNQDVQVWSYLHEGRASEVFSPQFMVPRPLGLRARDLVCVVGADETVWCRVEIVDDEAVLVATASRPLSAVPVFSTTSEVKKIDTWHVTGV